MGKISENGLKKYLNLTKMGGKKGFKAIFEAKLLCRWGNTGKVTYTIDLE